MADDYGVDIKFNMKGWGELEQKLAQAPDKLAKKVLRQACRDAAKPVLHWAQANAPVLKMPHPGRQIAALRNDIRIKPMARSRRRDVIGVKVVSGGKGGIFTGKQYYGGFQELGWHIGKRTNEMRRLQSIVNKSRKRMSALGLNSKPQLADARQAIPGKHFMKGAADANRSTVPILFSAALKARAAEAFK